MSDKFTAYEKSTGKVLYSGTAHEPEALEAETVAVLVGEAFSGGWLSDGVHHELPLQPSQHHVFDYTTRQWVDPRTPDTEWPLVRAKRDRLLQASDWTQLPDVPLATKQAWAAYRQALRDVTLQPDPFNIVWPVSPG